MNSSGLQQEVHQFTGQPWKEVSYVQNGRHPVCRWFSSVMCWHGSCPVLKPGGRTIGQGGRSTIQTPAPPPDLTPTSAPYSSTLWPFAPRLHILEGPPFLAHPPPSLFQQPSSELVPSPAYPQSTQAPLTDPKECIYPQNNVPRANWIFFPF